MGTETTVVVPSMIVVFAVDTVKTVVLVAQLSQDAVPAMVTQLDGTGEMTTVAVLAYGSMPVTVLLPTTKVLVVLAVKMLVLDVQSAHSAVRVADPDGDSGRMMNVFVALLDSVTVTVSLPTTVVLVVLDVYKTVLVSHSEQASVTAVGAGDGNGEMTKTSVMSQGSVTVTVVPPMTVTFVALVAKTVVLVSH